MPRRVSHFSAALLLLGVVAARAQEAAPSPTAVASPAPEDDISFTTPRSTMRGFLTAGGDDDWTRAASYLDLRSRPAARRASDGPTLARELKTVLDRKLWVDLDALSAEPNGRTDDGQPDDRDLVGTITTDHGPVAVLLQRVRGADGALEWKIAGPTVDQIPALYEEFGDGPLAQQLPPIFFKLRFLSTALWQWIGIAAVAILSYLFSWLAALVILRFTAVFLRRGDETDALLAACRVPLRLSIFGLLFASGVGALGLPIPVLNVFRYLGQILTAIALTWLAIRITTTFARTMELRLLERGVRNSATVMPLLSRATNIVIIFIAVLLMLANFGINVTAVLAGLGVGGLAVALAGQKTIENLFGGVTLLVDQPVRVGDFCRFGDRVGTVEDIGLRSTRVRSLDRTVITVPNAEFAGLQLENFALRDRIWLSTTIGVRYETTPDQLRFLLVEIKKMLLSHPKVHPDPARVRFTNFGSSSLDLEIFAYIRTSDINEFLAVREDIFLRIMDIVAESGTGFAFPSYTVYAAQDGGLDTERSKAAEEQVARWRSAHELYLPNFPAEQAKRIGDSLDYPPDGAPAPDKS